MNGTEQWEQIEALFHAALEHKPEERESFLVHQCSDSYVLVAVKRLLEEDASSGGILDSSSSGFARLLGELAQEEPEESLIGNSIGPYKVLDVLGHGGMGKVYLAEDTRLARKVALKFLSAGLASRGDTLRRFMTEARATSALNHPNIVTIHDIGREGGISYIAVEYIEGETLRQRMQRPLSLIESLTITIQMARALAAAHESGIVHRDVKPDNIMIRMDGLVKVVDFGLAKLTRAELFNSGPNSNSLEAARTIPGTVLGTVYYMSPEQASGQELDARTDVFSLGVVMYEMLAGHKPFDGDSLPAFLDCLIRRDPEPIPDLGADIVNKVRPILERSMAKDRAARYQNAGDLLRDLEQAAGEIETNESTRDIANIARPRPTGRSAVTNRPGADAARRTDQQADQPSSRAARNLSLIVGAVLLAAIAALIVHRRGSNTPGPGPYADVSIEKVTSSGDVQAVAASSGERLVAYSTQDENGTSVWVKDTSGGTDQRVFGPGPLEISGLTFSKDGSQIYYVGSPVGRGPGVLYKDPVGGGTPVKVKDGVMRRISFSPDGTQFAFVGDEGRSLVIANPDGPDERILATLGEDEIWRDPAWSPDGKTIACGIAANQSTSQYLAAVTVETGSISRIGQDQWIRVTGEEWAHDGSGLVMSAADPSSQILQLWFISYPDGVARHITNDAYDYLGVALDAGTGSILSVRSVSATDIWVTKPGEQNTAHRIPYPRRDSHIVHVAWTGDGRIVYSAGLRTTHDIWIMDANGEHQRQLTSGPGLKEFPCVSPDDRYIVFSSDARGSTAIRRMNIDGSGQVPLSSGSGGFYWPQFTADSKWVVYQSTDEHLWKIAIEGGQPVQLTSYAATFPAPSPDGGNIVCILRDQINSLAMVPIVGGAANRIVKFSNKDMVYLSRWSPNGGVSCLMGDNLKPLNVYNLSLDRGKTEQLTFFTDLQRISSYSWSRDGQLVLSRTSDVRDVVQLTGPGPSYH